MVGSRTLRVAALEVRLRADGPLQLPEYAGALFRGGFGKFLRDLVCRTGAQHCGGCAYLQKCAYGLVFETPADPATSLLLKAYPNAPHPFVLTPPIEPAGTEGPEFSLHLSLIGKGCGYLAYFIEGLDAMGRSGRFGGRYRISEIRDATGGRAQIYDGLRRKLVAPVPDWARGEISSRSGKRRMRLEFETPLRLREKGEYTRAPSFALLMQALVRRVHMLGCMHGGWPDDLSWRKPILEAADGVKTLGSRWEEFRWVRHSARQHRWIPMDGVWGWVEVEGNLEKLWPVVELGRHLHVGSGTTMGMGRYRVEALP